MQVICNSSKLRESRHEACYILADLKLQHSVSLLLLLLVPAAFSRGHSLSRPPGFLLFGFVLLICLFVAQTGPELSVLPQPLQ